jgi:hypothetical protein
LIDAAWGRGDWQRTIELLGPLVAASPDDSALRDKMYVAHYNAGQGLLSKGNKSGAAIEFSQAMQLDGTRGEAQAELVALTPTPNPTMTPVPPRPRSTPTAGVPTDVRAYTTYMQPRLILLTQAGETIGQLNDEASANPRLLLSDNWKIRVGLALAIMKNNGQQIQTYEPVPQDMNAADAFLVSAGKNIVSFVNDYGSGIDQMDASRIRNAGHSLSVATTQIASANVELRKIATKYGLIT